MYVNSVESQSSDSNSEESLNSEPPLVEVEKPKNLSKFIKEHYPSITLEDWYNWKWQVKNSITNSTELIRVLGIDTFMRSNFYNTNQLPFRITPYFAYTLSNLSDEHPLYKTIIPTLNEKINNIEEKQDPLNEENHSPVKNIVHRYPDRALFLVTGFCSAYCRFCTRTHMVSKRTDIRVSNSDWEEGFNYIEKHPEIRDVIVSGGDPFTIFDEQIDYILGRLRKIKHVEIIRIGSKIASVLPMRVTPNLVNILKKYSPIYISLHFTHPDEFTDDTKKACNMLADGGIVLRSQTVLLKDINDSVEIIKKLMHELLKVRVSPYYLYQMDKVPGAEFFETTIEKGLEIIEGLRGFTSGYAIPRYIVDSEFGKIDVAPNNIISKEGNEYKLKSYKDNIIIH
jgi:lysine 2,3-aminomutase